MKPEGLIILRSAVRVRLPLPKFPYISQGYASSVGPAFGGTGREQSEHNEQRAAQKSAQSVPHKFGFRTTTFPYNSPLPLLPVDRGTA
jgi:hypothetical protein